MRDTKTLFFSTCGVFIGFLLLVLVAYQPALQNRFVFDDTFQIINNPWITSLTHLQDIFFHHVWSFSYQRPGGPDTYYRPLMHVVFSLEYFFFHLHPLPWHVVNIVWHTVNAVLIFLFTLLFFQKILPRIGGGHEAQQGASDNIPFIPALLGSLLFLLHPLNAEVVNWIAAIPELALTSCVLLSVILYFSRESLWCRLASAFFFLLATLSKESGFLLLPLLLFFELFLFLNHQSFRENVWIFWKKNWAFFAMALLALSLRALTHDPPNEEQAMPGILFLLFNALIDGPVILYHYLQHFVIPTHLAFLYPFNSLALEHIPISALSLTIAIAAFLSRKIWLESARFRNIFFVSVFSLVWLIAFLGPSFLSMILVPSTLADRYFYLPSVGISLVFAYSVRALLHIHRNTLFRRGCLVLFVIILATLSTITRERSLVWENSETLFRDSITQFPEAPWPRFFLNDYNSQLGIPPPPSDFQKAFAAARKLSPEEEHDLVCQQRTMQYRAFLLGGNVSRSLELMHENKKDPACTLACTVSPTFLQSRIEREQGMAYFFLGAMREAEQHLSYAYEKSNTMETARSLAHYYCVAGNETRSAHFFQKALRLGDHPERIDLLQKKCALENPQDLYRASETFLMQ